LNRLIRIEIRLRRFVINPHQKLFIIHMGLATAGDIFINVEFQYNFETIQTVYEKWAYKTQRENKYGALASSWGLKRLKWIHKKNQN